MKNKAIDPDLQPESSLDVNPVKRIAKNPKSALKKWRKLYSSKIAILFAILCNETVVTS